MAVHQSFTDNPGLAFLLGPARPGFSGTWFGSISIWSGPIIGYTPSGNPVVEVAITGVPGVTAIQAEIFGTRTYDEFGLFSVAVTRIEWSLPGSATLLASYEFAAPLEFPLSISRVQGDWRFVDILLNGPTPQQLFDDYFQNADELYGGNAADIMNGGGGNDLIDGGGGADQLTGENGDDTFIYRSGDAVTGENIYGGFGNDAVLAIGAAVNGDIFQTGGVNISSINVSSVETVFLNGTEVVINAAQLGAGGFQTFVGRTGMRDQLTIGNVSNANLSTLNLTNWETQDAVAIVGTAGADSVTGTAFNDTFLGLQGADTFNGGNGNDRFMILDSDLNPFDNLTGGAGNDVLQVDSTAIASHQITPLTDLRNLTLSGIETLDVVKGSFTLDGSYFVGAISGLIGSPVTSTVGLNHIIGNGDGSGFNIVLLEIQLGNLLGINLSGLTFENWNDGFYIDKLVRIVAGAQTQLIYCPNEETYVNGSASVNALFVVGGNQADVIYGSYVRDVIQSGAGQDYVVTLTGNDYIDLGAGNDYGWAGDGDDSMSGGDGDDTLYGDSGVDWLLGNAGNDTLDGGQGTDHLWGGLGADAHVGGNDGSVDFARYDDANYGNLTIRLDNSAMNTGAAAGDTYVGIEGLVGGAGNDLVAGDGLNNYLYGQGGNDFIYGQAGNDFLSGDAGGDNLWGGAGADAHYGGSDAGIDYARYDDANWGNLSLRLDNAALNGGAAAVGDTYNGIEGLVGGLGNDVIIGNALANYLFGQGGADYIDGLGGSDYLNGGAGADRFRFSTALGAGNIDYIADFQHGVDDILLLQSLFSAVGASLTADEFRIGMAQDANDFLLYNNITGQLFYDSNANAAGGMVQFATVAAGTVLTFDDFIMA